MGLRGLTMIGFVLAGALIGLINSLSAAPLSGPSAVVNVADTSTLTGRGAYNAGRAAMKGEKYDDAIRFFTAAIDSGQLDEKTLAMAYVNRGHAFVQELNHTKDETFFKKAEADYASALATSQTYGILGFAGNFKIYAASFTGNPAYLSEALVYFDKGIELNPKSPNLYYGRARVYEAMGNRSAALSDVEASLALKPSEDALRLKKALTQD